MAITSLHCAADCGQPLLPDELIATVLFTGKPESKLHNRALALHGRCLRMQPTDPIVKVEWEPQGWTATCVDHGDIAQKDVKDDAHLIAASHIARVHVGAGL